VHETTLPYSPYQNAKQEAFWTPVEARLLAMLHIPVDGERGFHRIVNADSRRT
jgi:hypothetical protein